MTKERDVNAPGGGHNLRNYWVRGEGAAKIRWGTDGSFARCVAQLGDKVKDPQGLCAEYHKAATGEWPAEKGVESSMSNRKEFHGNHDQSDHNPHKKNIDDFKDPGVGLTKEENNRYQRAVYRQEKLADKIKLTAEERAELRELNRYIESIEDRDEDFSIDLSLADEDDEQLEAAIESKRKKAQRQAYATGDGDEPWSGVLSVEGVESGDGRLFALGGLDWEPPPQPLMYQPANVGGHNASILVGEIQQITRHGSRIRGKGTVFGSALRGEHGDDIRHMVKTGGVSVDVDKVKDANVELIFADGESSDVVGGNMFAKPETTIFHAGRIRGATLVAFPAFVEAKLEFTGETLTASANDEACGCETDDPLVASAHTITIPNLPKAEWFNEPTDVQVSGALTITDDGRVFGVVAPSDTTHRSVKARVPRNLDFSRFHKGETIVEGGKRVVTGVITASCGHAATQNYGTLNNRIEHYDNSCSVLANVRVGYARNGSIWVAGALNAGAQPEQVAQALGCALSLDVQPHPDRPSVREFIAAHLVPVPGFPLARTQASVIYDDGVLAASSVPVVRVAQPTYTDGETFEAAFRAIAMFKNNLATSVCCDPSSRKTQLARELELI